MPATLPIGTVVDSGDIAELNAQRSVLAARQAAERVTLQERHQRERAAQRARRQDGFPADGEELTAFEETGDAARRRHKRYCR